MFRTSFSFRKTKERAAMTRKTLNFNAEEFARELGPRVQTIDAKIGNEKLVFDAARGEWIADGAVSTNVSAREMGKLEKKKHALEEDNNILRTKVDLLLEMLAEVSAENELRRK